MKSNSKVLLTGITGFLGSHTAIQLLEKGYQVTGTLRNKEKISAVKAALAKHTSKIENLKVVVADLEDDKTAWETLMKNIDDVQHIASPFPKVIPKKEEGLIRPARQGTLNILSAAARHKVRRVVITGAGASITHGHPKSERRKTFDETNWANLKYNNDLTPYYKSKLIAEKAAWDFIKQEQSGLELAVVCPGLILGPLLTKKVNASLGVIIKVLDGSLPAVPKIGWEISDVRSIASLLILAMEKPQAANQRYSGAGGFVKYKEIAEILKKTYPQRKIPSYQLPDFMVRLLSLFDATIRPVLLDLGTERKMDNSKAIDELGWNPMAPKETIKSCAKSILDFGIVN